MNLYGKKGAITGPQDNRLGIVHSTPDMLWMSIWVRHT